MARTYPVIPHTVFGGGASAAVNGIAQFGSKQTGTPDYTTNIATIQALAAWLQGWAGAVVQGKVPPLEELNAAFLEPSYQIASLFECGIPDWNSGITYSKNSMAQLNGLVYQSLTDANINNNPSSSSANWQLYASSTAKGENLFRNAGLQIAQRGASGTVTAGSPAYTLDGWIVGGSTHNVGWSQQLGALGDGTPGLNLTPSGGTPTAAFIKQRIESLVMDGIPLTGFITVQCQITNLSGSSITPTLAINYANAQDNFSAVTSFLAATNLQVCPNSQTTTVSYTFQANINLFTGMEIIFGFGSGIVSTGITFNFPDCSYTPYLQLVGLQSNPPLAQIRPIGVEVPNCQRYLKVLGGDQNSQVIGWGVTIGSTGGNFYIPIPKMRGILPIASYSAQSDFEILDPQASGYTSTSMGQTGNQSSSDNLAIAVGVASGTTAGHFCFLIVSGSTSRLYISAEL